MRNPHLILTQSSPNPHLIFLSLSDDGHFPAFAPNEVDAFDCPGGSLILYNANTWHRAGLNISAGSERAACLHAFTPEWVLPKHDQMGSFKNFVASGQYAALDERERQDVRQLWVGELTEQRNSLGQLEMATAEQHAKL